jgi:hypothetical protein
MVAAHSIGDHEKQAGLSDGQGALLAAGGNATAVQGKDEVAIFVVPPLSTYIGEGSDPGAEGSGLN